jgi:hypothetical protein
VDGPQLATTRGERDEDERTDHRTRQHDHLGGELGVGDLDERIGDTPRDPENEEQDEATASHRLIIQSRGTSVQRPHCHPSSVLGHPAVGRDTIA